MTGWRRVKLIEVCREITDGSHFSPKSGVGDWPYVTVRDLTDGHIDFTNCAKIETTDFELLVQNGCKPDRGDVLFSKDGTVGKVALVEDDVDFVVLSSLAILRPEKNLINSEFLKYIMLSPDVLGQAVGMKTGVAIRRIILRNLKSVEFSLPPLPEQQRIVGILDQAFEGIAKAKAHAERNLANAKELFDSELEEVFSLQDASWSEATLSEVCLKFGRGKSRHRPRNDPSLYGGDYPFIQTGDVRNSGDWITAYSQTYNEKGLAQSLLWPRGTLCITIAANIAEIGILDFDACFPDSIIGCVVNEDKTSNEYLCYVLRYYQAHLKAQGKGSAQDNINLATFENQKFPFPSLPVQEEIVEKLNSIWSSIEAYELNRQAAITGIADLRRSILHLAFSGNL